MMITAARRVLVLSPAGRKGVSEGLWTFEITCSPSAVTLTASFPVLPSEPGAPLGQSGISFVSSALKTVTDRSSHTNRIRDNTSLFFIADLSLRVVVELKAQPRA